MIPLLQRIRFRYSVGVAALVWAAYLPLVLGLPSAEWREGAALLIAPLFGLTGALALWQARSATALTHPRLGQAWGLWALGILAWAATDLYRAAAQLLSSGQPNAVVLDGLHVLYYLCLILGAFRASTRRLSASETRKMVLDIVLAVATTVVGYWALLIYPGGGLAPRGPDAHWALFSASYPALDVLLTWIPLVVMLYRVEDPQPAGPILLLVVGAVCLWITDMVFGLIVNLGQLPGASQIGPGWNIGLTAFALAGLYQVRLWLTGHGAAERRAAFQLLFVFLRLLLPYLIIGTAYVVLMWAFGPVLSPFFLGLAGGLAVVVGLTLIRQTLTLSDNVQLVERVTAELRERQRAEAALQQLNDELEARVRERTAELTDLNASLRREIAERQSAEAALRQSEERLFHDATHDALTGLPNRLWFMERLRHALEVYRRQPTTAQFAVLYLDFDGFKAINDSLGHNAGDQFLMVVAERLQACLRATDTAARLGGDEFVVLAENVDSSAGVGHVADRLQQALAAPVEVSGQRVFASVSIGVVLSVPEYDRPEDLLRDADIALYRAKAAGKARYQLFDPALRSAVQERLRTETALREALERGEFVLYYQPILSLMNYRLAGFEALIRWRRPGHPLTYPNDFIPLAEETGLIIPLGYWTLEEACRQLRAWQMAYPTDPPLTVNVNISTRHFMQADFVQRVAETVARSGLSPRHLKLEITENAFIQDPVAVAGVISRLRGMGVDVQIDDFGTGYSNLGYLHQLPISTLKISQSFVNEVSTNRHRAEILQAVVTLAHNLGMAVVAEGVESAEQLDHIRAIECEEGQGYFIGRPGEPQAIEGLLRQHLSAGANLTRP